MTAFGTPSAKHHREPSVMRSCTTCKRDVQTKIGDELCPRCHEATLLPPAEHQRQSRKTV